MPDAAILGLRPHTYWTAAVVLAGAGGGPTVIARRRIEFALGRERFVYHQAAEDPNGAPALIAKVRRAVETRARDEIGALLDELARGGHWVGIAVVPAGAAHVPTELADILRAHAHMHSAEGQFYRDAAASACRSLGLEVRRVVEKTLMGLGGQVLGLDKGELKAGLKRLGLGVGPPWSEDYHLAALGAWIQPEIRLAPKGEALSVRRRLAPAVHGWPPGR